MLLRDVEIGDHVLTLNPRTNEVFWEEILIRVHYEWYDQNDEYVSMRTLYLEHNISAITLSHDHIIYVDGNNGTAVTAPTVVQSGDVGIGDKLFYYDHDMNETLLVIVSKIEESVMRQKRVIFGLSEYTLINDIVASPFVGPHPSYHLLSHQLVSFTKFGFLRYFSYQPLSSLVVIQVSNLIYVTYFIYAYITEIVGILLGVIMYKRCFVK